MANVHPLYVLRPWRLRKRRVFPLFDKLLAAIGFDLDNHDELLIIRVHPPYVTFRVARPDNLVPLSQMELSHLPPAWPKKGTATQKP